MRISFFVTIVVGMTCHLGSLAFLSTALVSFRQLARSPIEQGSSSSRTSLVILQAKARKAQERKKAERTRPQGFYDAINGKPTGAATTAATTTTTETKTSKPQDERSSVVDDTAMAQSMTGGDNDSDDAGVSIQPVSDADREARAAAARQRVEQRPEVSTMIIDDDTGIEVIAQGKSVMDVVTRRPVKLSPLGPPYRLAQMFPGVPPDVRHKYRVNWRTIEVPEMVKQLQELCRVKLPDGTRDIPPHPSIANKAIDYVVANRDYLGWRMKKAMGRLLLRSMSLGNKEEAQEYRKLLKNYLTIENHVSAPFRQMIFDAEGRVGPNFGNLDLKSYCGKELYERVADYLVLKGMVAHWEKKVVDADFVEKNPQTKTNYISTIARGDPRRYLPDPPILFTLKECTQVCYMAQQMTKTFVETPELFNDFPPEVRFLEYALTIKGGTPLRKFMIEEFCPAEGITPEGLREGLRRLLVHFENMQIDPYADIANVMERLCRAMAVGTDDERDPYLQYIANVDRNGPGAFPTYTFDVSKQSLVRFLDAQYQGVSTKMGGSPLPLPNFFNFGGSGANAPAPVSPKSKTDSYKVPEARAAGRAHELGWLDMFDDEEKDEDMRLGRVRPGKIIMEED